MKGGQRPMKRSSALARDWRRSHAPAIGIDDTMRRHSRRFGAGHGRDNRLDYGECDREHPADSD